MIKTIIKKIKNKKWLTLCLFLGLSFLVAVFSCFPMFEAGAIDVLIHNEFVNQMKEENKYSFILSQKEEVEYDSDFTVDAVEQKSDAYHEEWNKRIGRIGSLGTQTAICTAILPFTGELSKRSGGIRLCYMPDLFEHATILSGEDYDSCSFEDTEYACIAPPVVLDMFSLSLGEQLNFTKTSDAKKDNLQLTLCGSFAEKDGKDIFWEEGPNASYERVYVNKETFEEIVKRFELPKVYLFTSERFNYKQVNNKNIEKLSKTLDAFSKEFTTETENVVADLPVCFSHNLENIITHYESGRKTIRISIWVLQIPIIGMVFAFIFMVSKQILEAERNEMAMLFSRGLKRRQIVSMYALQFGVISLVALGVGIPLGFVLCKIAAGANNFLTFSFENTSMYRANIKMFGYGLVASILGMIIMLIPTVKYSKVSIVEHKSDYRFHKKMLWEKCFLDVLLLVASIYLLRNYNQNLENVRLNALNGKTMDPMIFMDIVMFIVAAGLFSLRLSQYLVRIVYRIGKKKWKPAMYASFLQITRNFGKQCFISVFTVLTIAMGIFYANSARTINGNYEDRIEYDTGADVVVREKPKATFYLTGDGKTGYYYIEPDYLIYENLCKDKVCKNSTRVINTNKLIVEHGGSSIECSLLGIHTKEFGEVAHFKKEWMKEKHWFESLNALAVKSNGVIISKNLAEHEKLSIGDQIDCSKYGELANETNMIRGKMECKIVDIVEDFPGFTQYYFEEGQQRENYLVVMNYASVIDMLGVYPYEVWVNLDKKTSYSDVFTLLENREDTEYKYMKSIDEEIDKLSENCILQITNGLFTLSFIIALILCVVGFLIYWIASISQRQLMFGIYRAMGMSVKEINLMLSNEHFFSTLLSVLSGGIVGTLATVMFARLFALIYLPQKHNLGIYMTIQAFDYVKLGIILAVMIGACLMCLRNIIKKMDISKSLKLGED